MNSKLYNRAYKFLKIRATQTGSNTPFKAIDDLTSEERSKVIKFLSYNHQVKFI